MKKSNIVILLVIIIAVIATQFNNTDTTVENAASQVAEAVEAGVEAEVDGDSEAVDDSDHRWGNPNTLHDHYERHGSDFNAKNAQDYARQAHEFYENRDEYQIKNDNGVLRIYDAGTNTFGAYNKNGTTRTFYKPEAGQAYFDRQPGS